MNAAGEQAGSYGENGRDGMAKRLMNVREQQFVLNYIGVSRGNGTDAAKRAGYSPKTAYSMANQLLKRIEVKKAIETLLSRKRQQAILTNEEIDQELSAIVKRSKDTVRVRAAAELNKCRGRHSVNVNVAGKLTFEEAIEQTGK